MRRIAIWFSLLFSLVLPTYAYAAKLAIVIDDLAIGQCRLRYPSYQLK